MYPLVVVLLINGKKSEIEMFGFSSVSVSMESAGHDVEIPLRNVERAVRDEEVQDVMRGTIVTG
ncbi:hypothetical protein C0993_005966, partial [Termitomyces sp. T159_Od127]